MIHELKIFPWHYEDVSSGIKTFEIRRTDRDFNVNDILILREYNYTYTGRQLKCLVTYIIKDTEFVKLGYCVMSIKIIND